MLASTERKGGVVDDLMSFWPSLPFMALGLWSAWTALAYSGSLWLSDIEVNGYYLSQMYIYSTIACGVTFLVCAVLAQRLRCVRVYFSRAVFVGGLVSGLSCFAIVVIGPFWLGSVLPNTGAVFVASSVLSGVGTALTGLRCGFLYSQLPPRRTLIYASLSQLVAAFIYFVVLACPNWAPIEHGPSLAGIVAFCVLPVAAAGLSVVPPTKNSGIIDSGDVPPTCSASKLPPAFWGFVVFVFIMNFCTSMMRANVVTTHALASTIDGNNVLMLMRIVMAALFIVYAVRSKAQAASIGKICSLATVFSAMATACVAAFGGLSNALSLVIYFGASMLEFTTWCLLAFVAIQKRVSALVVFGIGRGVFILACGLGWCAGTIALPYLPTGTIATVFFLVMAGVMLLLAMGIFSERDYERLFSAVSEDELSIDDLFDIERREAQLAAERRTEKRGRFSLAIEHLADSHNLSSREAEVLRCLAMGYGSERIAETMGIKVNTVRAHTHNVYVKLDVHSREELMRLVDTIVAQK